MFVFAFLFYFLVVCTLPTSTVALAAFFMGLFFAADERVLRFSNAFAASSAVLCVAFFRNGQSHGLISLRVSQLLGLPSEEFLFLLVCILVWITAYLFFECGRWLRDIIRWARSK